VHKAITYRTVRPAAPSGIRHQTATIQRFPRYNGKTNIY
jgi:hypothetical protein